MFFVVGVGRSGTSLVQSMLASHPEVAFGPETSIFRRLVASGTLNRWIRQSSPDKLADTLGNDKGFRRTGLSVSRVLRRAIAQGPLSAGAVYRAVLSCTAEDAGKGKVGDKDPRSIEWLELVPFVSEQARIVHVVRDPRDVVASKMKASWSRNGAFIKHLFANRVQIKLALDCGQRVFGSQYHIILYEDLLREPNQTLRRLCRSLMIGFSDEMLCFSGAARDLVSADEISWKQETLGPLLSRNVGNWRAELTPYQTALTERICAEVFDQFGYRLSGCADEVKLSNRIKIQLWSSLIKVADPLYRRYRLWLARRARRYV